MGLGGLFPFVLAAHIALGHNVPLVTVVESGDGVGADEMRHELADRLARSLADAATLAHDPAATQSLCHQAAAAARDAGADRGSDDAGAEAEHRAQRIVARRGAHVAVVRAVRTRGRRGGSSQRREGRRHQDARLLNSRAVPRLPPQH